MTSISEQIIQNSNYTTIAKAQESPTYSTSVSGDDFLYLMTEQLKYQDPTNPMDNNDMLAQEAQFQSLSQLESLTEEFSKFANVFQANSLIGQNVEVTVDDKVTSGQVEYVDFSDASGASVSIGGKMFPLSSITKVYPNNSTSLNSEKNSDNITLGQQLLETISNNIGNLTSKVTEYLDKK